MSEITGYNTEVTVRGREFHVQTEDIGNPDHPTINTLIFLDGALVHKISTPLDLGDAPTERAARVAEQIKQQHTAALNRVRHGDFVSR